MPQTHTTQLNCKHTLLLWDPKITLGVGIVNMFYKMPCLINTDTYSYSLSGACVSLCITAGYFLSPCYSAPVGSVWAGTMYLICMLHPSTEKKPLCQATPSDMTEGVFVCVCCVNTAKQGQQAFILSNWWTPPPFFCCKINTDTFFGEAFLFLLTAPCGKLRSGSSIFSACVLFFLPLSLTIYLMYALSTPRNAILCKIFSSFEITRVHWPQSTGYL